MSSTSSPPTRDPGSGTTRPAHRRASQACQQCRSRKVKCVMAGKGAPCHNCTVDGTECTILLSKRSRKYRLEKRQLLDADGPRQWLLPHKPHRSEAPASAAGPSQCLSDAPRQDSTSQPQTATIADFVPTPISTSGSAPPISIQDDSSFANISSPELPTYIRPSSRLDLDAEDLQYLSRRGALSIPQPRLRDELLLAFALYVYPYLPVIDLQEVVNAIEQKPGCTISLILYQALMFSGTAFVDLELLLEAGFDNRLEARAYFFRKVKLLYDFEWESDRVVLIQATLLHAWWYVSTNDQKDPWHWLGIVISLASRVGLDQPSVHVIKDAQTRRLWRRIWWTIVSRDRLMSIVTRNPLRIADAETKLAPLEFRDFDTKPIQATLPSLQHCEPITDCVCRVMLADIFMSQINLVLISGKILTHLYNLQGFAASSSEWSMWYGPRRKQDLDVVWLDRLQNELATWSSKLNNYCSMEYHYEQSTDDLQNKVLHIHTAALRLLYLLTQEALHRPLTFPAGLRHPMIVPSVSDDDSTTRARSEVGHVASQMANIIKGLAAEGLWQYLPPLNVGCVLTAIASFLVEIKLARRMPADEPDHPYHDCTRALLSLKAIWPVTKGSCAMVDQMAANNQVWYARSLKMLAPPAPAEPGTRAGLAITPHSGGSEAPPQANDTHPVAGPGPQQVPTISMDLPFEQRDVDMVNVSDHNAASRYLATMYPFLWTPADFDVFGPSSYRELFSDQGIDAFGFGTSLPS